MAKKSSPLDNLSLAQIAIFARRHRYLTFAVVSWVVMVILLLVIVAPQGTQISTLNSQLSSDEQKFTDAKNKVLFLQSLNLSTLQSQAALFSKALPTVKPVIPLITSLDQLANQSGVSFKGIELNPGNVASSSGSASSATTVVVQSTLATGVSALPFKLEAQGTFAGMNTFFQALDSFVPLMNIKSIQFSVLSKSAGGTGDQYKATLEIEALFVPSVTIAKDAPLRPLTGLENQTIASVSAMLGNLPSTPFDVGVLSATSSGRANVFSY